MLQQPHRSTSSGNVVIVLSVCLSVVSLSVLTDLLLTLKEVTHTACSTLLLQPVHTRETVTDINVVVVEKLESCLHSISI